MFHVSTWVAAAGNRLPRRLWDMKVSDFKSELVIPKGKGKQQLGKWERGKGGRHRMHHHESMSCVDLLMPRKR